MTKFFEFILTTFKGRFVLFLLLAGSAYIAKTLGV